MPVLLLNKPFGVLTKFTDAEGRPTLADYVDVRGVYPAGRLDRDSEGLLVLTDDGALQHRISHPRHTWSKTYWDQIVRAPDKASLRRLETGVDHRDGPARAEQARLIPAPSIWERVPPIRVRKTVPTAWIEVTLSEGRNRQVRRMTAAIGHPTLRLIRRSIGPWSLEGLAPGCWREVDAAAWTGRRRAR